MIQHNTNIKNYKEKKKQRMREEGGRESDREEGKEGGREEQRKKGKRHYNSYELIIS